MSRTYREIPDSGFRDRVSEDNVGLLRPVEEKKGINNHTKIVRDKDNHGCTYSTPKDWRKTHQKRMRAKERDQLRKIEQSYRAGELEDIILPKPKEFQPYYW